MAGLIPVLQNESDSGWYIGPDGKVGFYIRNVKVFEATAVGTGLTFASAFTAGAITATDLIGTLEKWVYRIPALSGIDTDGLHGGLAGCDQVLDVTKTEAGATLALVYDDSAVTKYRQLSAASAADFIQYQLFPNNTQALDACYFGGTSKFCELYFDMSATVQTYDSADGVLWEYWDGAAWSTLTLHDYTDATAQNGLRSFGRDGAANFLPPSDWAATEVNSTSAYWIRCKVVTAANILVVGITNSKRHYVCQPTDGFVIGHSCTINALSIRDEAGTAHTTADIKFILFNFTTGAQSAEMTFPQDKRNDRFTSLALSASLGDLIGVLVTQEDGSAEMGPVTLELEVTLT